MERIQWLSIHRRGTTIVAPAPLLAIPGGNGGISRTVSQGESFAGAEGSKTRTLSRRCVPHRPPMTSTTGRSFPPFTTDPAGPPPRPERTGAITAAAEAQPADTPGIGGIDRKAGSSGLDKSMISQGPARPGPPMTITSPFWSARPLGGRTQQAVRSATLSRVARRVACSSLPQK